MCENCWRDADSPTEWTPQTARLLELIEDLYAIHPTGGPLHTVLDDWNIDHETIVPYYDGWDEYADIDLDDLYYDGWPIADLDPGAPAVTEGLGVSTRTLCDDIASILNGMTVDQRYAALAYHEGYAVRPIP